MPENNQFSTTPNMDGQRSHGTSVFAELSQEAVSLQGLVVVDGKDVRACGAMKDEGILKRFICQAVVKYNLPHTWPEAVQHQVKSVPEKVEESETKGRIDLRNIPLVTIDAEDTPDLNAAVFCQKEDDKFHLIVATADVSYYVHSGSAIDNEALERCTTVAFPQYVIPMLPVELSNGICSLNPNVDRLCMVCDMIINQKGNIERYGFYPAVMKSHARLTYTEVHHMITEGEAIKREHQPCVSWIKNLYEAYKALRRASDARGVVKFRSTEVHFLFDQNGKISGMEPDDHTEAHELIKECMIAANICAATFVKVNKCDSLYRIQDRPTPERLKKQRAILARYGIDLRGGDYPTPRDFRLVLEQVEKLPEGVHQSIALQMLRSMTKACYSPDNIGHFGLALENYAHFNSPIRRYPDLQIQRVIKFILENQKKRSWGKIGSRFYSHSELVNLGLTCSEHEVTAADAEYHVSNSLKCEYVKNFLNEVVQGTVSTVNRGDVFVTLNDFFIDGRLEPDNALLRTDTERHCFSVSGKTYYVGDQIVVRIVDVNSDMNSTAFGIKVQLINTQASNLGEEQQFNLKQSDTPLGKQDYNTDNMTTLPQRHYGIVSKTDLLTAKPANDTTDTIASPQHDSETISKVDLTPATPVNDTKDNIAQPLHDSVTTSKVDLTPATPVNDTKDNIAQPLHDSVTTSKLALPTATPVNGTKDNIAQPQHDSETISDDLLPAKHANDQATYKLPQKLTTKSKALFTILGIAMPIALVGAWYFLGGESEQSRASMLFDQCQANYAEACTQLGLMYQDGEEVKANPYVAQALFTKGCSLQNADACGYLGQIYAKGKAVDIRSLPDLPGQASYSEQDIEQMRLMLLEGENSRNVLKFEPEQKLQ